MNKIIQLIIFVSFALLLIPSCRKAKERIFLNPEFTLKGQKLFKGTVLMDLNEDLSGLKKFEITFGKKKLKFDVQVEYFNNRLTLVAMTPIKSRLFVIQHTKKYVRYLPEPFFKAPLKPIHILRDFYLSEISADKLKNRLAILTLKEENKNNEHIREFYLANEKLITITYKENEVLFHNKLKDYVFKIKTVYSSKDDLNNGKKD
ncbi:MAG: hypothetical protein COA79_09815 [Planctomycetota bacterium]|nr:MAG: hypothetical protein COA79_09815 [Planctomycetota bacterium]